LEETVMTTTQISVDREAAVVGSVPTGLWIDGVDRPATGGATFPVHDPSTGEVVAEVADATPEDALGALDTAVTAQRQWARTPRGSGARSSAEPSS
jgi:succinate-semialdehyde dehydrogenase/glutarate-semialdehyde dehydrogenase